MRVTFWLSRRKNIFICQRNRLKFYKRNSPARPNTPKCEGRDETHLASYLYFLKLNDEIHSNYCTILHIGRFQIFHKNFFLRSQEVQQQSKFGITMCILLMSLPEWRHRMEDTYRRARLLWGGFMALNQEDTAYFPQDPKKFYTKNGH